MTQKYQDQYQDDRSNECLSGFTNFGPCLDPFSILGQLLGLFLLKVFGKNSGIILTGCLLIPILTQSYFRM